MSSGESDYLRLTGMHAPKPLVSPAADNFVPSPAAAEPPAVRIGAAVMFPGDRKTYPVFTGLLRYFPDACAAVANCSHVANEQHNPGEPVHWDRNKSIGEGNELLRHLMQAGTFDTDGIRHTAKAAWRALELLQREIEKDRA